MITIEFSFAWLFCILMIIGFILIVCGIITFKGELIFIGFLFVLVGDLACVFGSANYMSHPTNGFSIGSSNKCYEYNYSTGYLDNAQSCIMPTVLDNPYEKQPLHPIAWIGGLSADSSKTLNSMVRFKVT